MYFVHWRKLAIWYAIVFFSFLQYLSICKLSTLNKLVNKINNRNTRRRCEICSKLTIKAPKRRQCGRSWAINRGPLDWDHQTIVTHPSVLNYYIIYIKSKSCNQILLSSDLPMKTGWWDTLRAPGFSHEQSAFTQFQPTLSALNFMLSPFLIAFATREKNYDSFWDFKSAFCGGSSDLQPPSCQP